jgi:enamine deaminase RidA (YjgF/YER057c/UK114 family)
MGFTDAQRMPPMKALDIRKELQMEIERKLQSMGFKLPNPPVTAANYIRYVRVGNLLFVGGNIGRINGDLKYRGKVGETVTLEQAYDAARNCGLNHLAIMKAALGDLDKVERIVKVLRYVNVAPGFTDMPKVVNGESDCWSSFGAKRDNTPAQPLGWHLSARILPWRRR